MALELRIDHPLELVSMRLDTMRTEFKWADDNLLLIALPIKVRYKHAGIWKRENTFHLKESDEKERKAKNERARFIHEILPHFNRFKLGDTNRGGIYLIGSDGYEIHTYTMHDEHLKGEVLWTIEKRDQVILRSYSDRLETM